MSPICTHHIAQSFTRSKISPMSPPSGSVKKYLHYLLTATSQWFHYPSQFTSVKELQCDHIESIVIAFMTHTTCMCLHGVVPIIRSAVGFYQLKIWDHLSKILEYPKREWKNVKQSTESYEIGYWYQIFNILVIRISAN